MPLSKREPAVILADSRVKDELVARRLTHHLCRGISTSTGCQGKMHAFPRGRDSETRNIQAVDVAQDGCGISPFTLLWQSCAMSVAMSAHSSMSYCHDNRLHERDRHDQSFEPTSSGAQRVLAAARWATESKSGTGRHVAAHPFLSRSLQSFILSSSTAFISFSTLLAWNLHAWVCDVRPAADCN